MDKLLSYLTLGLAVLGVLSAFFGFLAHLPFPAKVKHVFEVLGLWVGGLRTQLPAVPVDGRKIYEAWVATHGGSGTPWEALSDQSRAAWVKIAEESSK